MKSLAVFLLVSFMVALTSGAPKTNSGSNCPHGWTKINHRCFLYVPDLMTWAKAEKNCLTLGANLASVHSLNQYQQVQALITAASHGSAETWIGGSDAAEEGTWLWIDGSQMQYLNWCAGQPDNGGGNQNCLQMNWSSNKCWDDLACNDRRPSVCAKTV